MKILVCSDSHSGLRFMRRAITAIKPDALIHLGDYYDDGLAMAQENPHLRIFQVPGNCDRYRCPPDAAQTLCYPVCGVQMYMTHGHLHGVKIGIGGLVKDARRCSAQAVLYGHTHVAQCQQEPDGLWILNPGSCGSSSGSVGIIEIRNDKISDCRILTEFDLEEFI